MDKLGSTYFFVVILLITICLFVIMIVNSVYFTDIHNKGSENLSNTQSQQLIYLNMLTAILLFICLILLGYMMIVPNKKSEQIKHMNNTKEEKLLEFDNVINDVEKMRNDREKKIKTKKAMIELSDNLKVPLDKSIEENKKLKKEIGKLSAKVKLMDEEINNLFHANTELEYDNNKLIADLDEKDKDYKLKLEILEEEKNKESIFDLIDDPYLISSNSLFDNSFKSNITSIPELFDENASLEKVLEEIPMSSVIDYSDKSYDYDLPVNRTNYTSYKTDSIVDQIPKVSNYKPFIPSFLKK